MYDYEWYPKEKSEEGCGAWVESNGFKIRYKMDETGNVYDLLISNTKLSEADAQRNHVHFYWSSNSMEWKSSAKFCDPTSNKLHRFFNLSTKDAICVFKNLGK